MGILTFGILRDWGSLEGGHIPRASLSLSLSQKAKKKHIKNIIIELKVDVSRLGIKC